MSNNCSEQYFDNSEHTLQQQNKVTAEKTVVNTFLPYPNLLDQSRQPTRPPRSVSWCPQDGPIFASFNTPELSDCPHKPTSPSKEHNSSEQSSRPDSGIPQSRTAILITRKPKNISLRYSPVVNPDIVEKTIESFCSAIGISIIADVCYRIKSVQAALGSICLLLAIHIDDIIATVPG